MVSESKYFRADYEQWDRERELRGGATQTGADMLVFSATPAWESGCGGPPRHVYCGQCGGVTQAQRCTVCGCSAPGQAAPGQAAPGRP